MQEWIKVGQINVPIIIGEGGEKYYPISWISEKVLLRSGKGFISKNIKEQYVHYIKKFKIDFKENNIQTTNCISEEGLKAVLCKTEIGRLTQQQRINQNKLHDILKIERISTKRHIIEYMGRDILNQHDKYTKEIIKIDIDEHIEKNEKLLYQLCVKCDKHYPMTSRYFSLDNRSPNGFNKVCKVCNGITEQFTHFDLIVNNIRKQGGEDLYEAYKNNSVISIFEAYRKGIIKHFPDCYVNKEDYLKLIKYIYKKGEINKDYITLDVIKDVAKLKSINSVIKLNDVYVYLFGEDYYLYPWRYGKFRFGATIHLTYDIACKVLNNYIKEHKISFDPLKFDYEKHCMKARIGNVTSGSSLEFAVKFNEYKYAGYMFETRSKNYYCSEDNLLFDLKYLIEKDMKIEVNKVPLYITKNVLQKKVTPIYNYIVTKGNGSLFYWFDRLYPNKFIETDFDINAYRLEFDSDTEAFIHDILKDKFKNRLIYNQRNGEREIRLNGMSPDWFVFTDKGVWIIEYFGMFNWKNRKNSRARNYIKKTINKLRRYRDVTGYNKLFLYLEDTYNDCFGIVEKLKAIEKEIENVDV